MPCAIKLQVHQAKGLCCDRSEDGLYLEVSLHEQVQFSSKSMGPAHHPIWNDCMVIELTDDLVLQTHPLRMGVCADDAGPPKYGSVTIDLEQALYSRRQLDPGAVVSMQGWFPLFDTMSGICGHILVSVRLQFVGDLSYNDRLTSSVGVRFFSISAPPRPSAFAIEQLFGLVEVLKVVQDPEYNWRDLIRSDRSSNEERLRVFQNSTMQARRQLGKKVLRMGADAVLGYREYVDLEGDVTDRICIRAFGTAARLASKGPFGSDGMQAPSSLLISHGLGDVSPSHKPLADPPLLQVNVSGDGQHGRSRTTIDLFNRGIPEGRASGASQHPKDTEDFANVGKLLLRRGDLHCLERLPPHVGVALGGVVAARAVKVFNSRTTQDHREGWWKELRDEILSHARALGCDTIVGYQEQISITDDLALLSVMGTALGSSPSQPGAGRGAVQRGCSLVHSPEGRHDAARLSRCPMCHEGFVPAVLLATVDFPEGLAIAGRTELVEARVCRMKRKLSGEANAHELAEALPFIELELHKQLVHKMRVMGLNAAFGLRVEISHGPSLLVGVATATAANSPALPPPPLVKVEPGRLRQLGDLSFRKQRRVSERSTDDFDGRVPPSRDVVQSGRMTKNSVIGWGKRMGSYLQCPARCYSLRPRGFIRRSLMRLRIGSLTQASSASDVARPIVYAENYQDRSFGSDTFERLSAAVARHRHRRQLGVDETPHVADSFDWPEDEIQATFAQAVGGDHVEGDGTAVSQSGSSGRGSPLQPRLVPENPRLPPPLALDLPITSYNMQPTVIPKPVLRQHGSGSFGTYGNPSAQERRFACAQVDGGKAVSHEEPRGVFVFEVDDEADEDLLAVIDDPLIPENMSLCTVECQPGGGVIFRPRDGEDPLCSIVYAIRRVDLYEELGIDRASVSAGAAVTRTTARLTSRLAVVLNEMYACVLFRQFMRHGRDDAPICSLAALRWRIAVLEDDVIELVLTGQMLASPRTRPVLTQASSDDQQHSCWKGEADSYTTFLGEDLASESQCVEHRGPQTEGLATSIALLQDTFHFRSASVVTQDSIYEDASLRPLHSHRISAPPHPVPEERSTGQAARLCSLPSSRHEVPTRFMMDMLDHRCFSKDSAAPSVLVSALSAVPHRIVDRYCGLVTVHMIKETVNVTRQFESLQVFYHQFVAEALQTAKAHVSAVGGNALLGYRINNLFFRQDKRRAYAVISISGDSAKLHSHAEAEHQLP
eukprot:TRINITY_DN56029_c0_g1_i1.p1 TRINITY_DN56029_c0_g1~~TRINITY_DN56029_c0_g1_i1.p1  ORF type:complete len:1230 (-),score=132.65 TRINITY_DN56029_c0_g1_i1:165-3854(-)